MSSHHVTIFHTHKLVALTSSGRWHLRWNDRMTSVVLLVLILLVEMAAISSGPVATVVIALIILHAGIKGNVRTRVLNNLGLMVLELVEVGHTIATHASELLAARVV